MVRSLKAISANEADPEQVYDRLWAELSRVRD
jgi:hypothetical protein